jgi:taurine dioxygenase
MNAPAKFDSAALVQPSATGFGATITHPDFDRLVDEPGFLENLVPLLGRHLVLRIDAPPFEAASLGKVQNVLGISSVNKGPRLPGFEHIIQFASPGNPASTPQSDADAAQIMHHDSVGLAEPPLYAIVNTKSHSTHPSLYSWIDMQAVYRDLPDALKQRVNALRVVHPVYPDIVTARVHRDVKAFPAEARDAGEIHPLVARHPVNGRPMLLLSVRRDAKIVGMDAAASLALLTELWTIVESSPHRWQSQVKGDEILIWDNLATVHDRPPFSAAEPRKIWFANLAPARPTPMFAA